MMQFRTNDLKFEEYKLRVYYVGGGGTVLGNLCPVGYVVIHKQQQFTTENSIVVGHRKGSGIADDPTYMKSVH